MKAKQDSENLALLSTWVVDFGDSLYAWASRAVKDKALAQDLVQDTFLSACQHLDTFKGESAPKTWLLSILKNKVIDHFRKESRRKNETLDPDADICFDAQGRWKDAYKPNPWNLQESSPMNDPEFEMQLLHCISKLPENWAKCIQLKYFNEKKTPEICQHLDISTSNYWQILHRAKLSLRNCLEHNWINLHQ